MSTPRRASATAICPSAGAVRDGPISGDQARCPEHRTHRDQVIAGRGEGARSPRLVKAWRRDDIEAFSVIELLIVFGIVIQSVLVSPFRRRICCSRCAHEILGKLVQPDRVSADISGRKPTTPIAAWLCGKPLHREARALPIDRDGSRQRSTEGTARARIAREDRLG